VILETHQKFGAGIEAWRNRNGIRIIRLHHTADPAKQDEWAEREAAKYGGRTSRYWQREYDINFAAGRGGLVFPGFSIATHCIDPLDLKLIHDWPKYRVIDPGYNHATAVGWFTVNDGVLYQYREYRAVGKQVKEIVPDILSLSGKEEYKYTLIDPSAFAKTLAGAGRSVADLFREAGLSVNKAYRAPRKIEQIPSLGDLFVVDERGEPRCKITKDCPRTIYEIKRYRFKERMTSDQPEPDQVIKVDDDHVDVLLYAAAALPLSRSFHRDPLTPWYTGNDWVRRRAEGRRMRAYVPGSVEMEP
jgi:hypothetical protein